MNDKHILSPVDIERSILNISEAMEEQTNLYADLSEAAAEREADYKYAAAKLLISISQTALAKLTIAERQARVDVQAEAEYRAWKLAEARRQASRESILSLRAHLDAMRTLSASLRHQI